MITRSHYHQCRTIRHFTVAASALALAIAPLVGCGATDGAGPRNIIVMIGDGMGFNQVDMASLYRSGTSDFQVTVATGATSASAMPGTASLPFETFPVQEAVSTYSVDGSYDPALAWSDPSYVEQAPTDSAAAATALASGVKTYDAAIGVGPDEQPVELITERAASLGKATGVVTTVPLSHATPAGFAAHDLDRDDFEAIASDYLSSELDVVMGAGHPLFTDDHTATDAGYEYVSKADWAALTAGTTPFTFIEDRTDFDALVDTADPPDRVFGIAQVATTLQERRSGDLAAAPFAVPLNDVPGLTTLELGALNVLDQDPDGLFLMIEGGAIDWAGHDNSAGRLIEEALAFDDAVQAVVSWIERESSWDETLLIVTADHESGYLTAPGSGADGWKALTGTQGSVPAHVWNSEHHTNSLVPLFAKGVGATALAARADRVDPVRGTFLDNTEIGQVMLDELWG
jgi:alkaline phosphatase